MFEATYTVNNSKFYTGEFQAVVETDDVQEIERTLNIQYRPYTTTVLSVAKA